MTATAALPFLFPRDRAAAMSSSDAPRSDEDLVAATLSGNDESFAELIRRHKRKVFAMAARFARDDHQLDDIAQEAFVRVFKNLKNFRREAPFEHWLARICASACYDFLRRERRHRDTVAFDLAAFDLHDGTVDTAIAAGRARELLAWAMGHLRPDEQLILTLCEIEERSVREVVQLTGWSESNVKVRAFRARAALKRVLEDHAES
jgi:RNA polymerase sigma-70 factor (ECF subfamily)